MRAGDDFPRRTMIGRVYRVDTIGEGARGRTSFEFDALDERVLDGVELRQLYLSGRVKPFGLVRIMTTTARFKEVFGSLPTEGAWYRLELTPRDPALKRGAGERLLSWHAQLTATHHGALFNGGVPPAPASAGLAIVSVGKGNHYKHPKLAALKRHRRHGWSRIRMTQKKSGASRGPKWFT